MKYDRRFIEDTFPIKQVSIESIAEKGVRQGHISSLHTWWARRPLASSRSTIFASLFGVPKGIKEREEISRFIVNLSKWENTFESQIIQNAKEKIAQYYNALPPIVIDPFAGGGSIPLEALRMGCTTYSSDLNPVSVLIQKCLLEYPQLWTSDQLRLDNKGQVTMTKDVIQRITEDILIWGKRIRILVKPKIEKYYPQKKNATFVGSIFARTVPCQNPSCGQTIPLIKQYWLSKKKEMNIALYPKIEDGTLKMEIRGDGFDPLPPDFDPSNGTVSKAVVTCPICKSTIDSNKTRQLFIDGKSSEKLLVNVWKITNESGKKFILPNTQDLELLDKTKEAVQKLQKQLWESTGINPVPDEETPEGRGRGAERAFSLRQYGLNEWGDLFNSRQKLAMMIFSKEIRDVYDKMIEEGTPEDQGKAMASYLALAFDKLVGSCNSLCRWKPGTVQVIPVLSGTHALPILWDYFELNPISGISRSWINTLRVLLRSLNVVEGISGTVNISQNSATNIPHPDNTFDAIFTDPPYYDNVPYSYLSDFFYVWLKRTISHLYPNLFSTPLTPKKNEIVTYSFGPEGFDGGTRFFEEKLTESFKEFYRVLKPGGIAVIVYAHKSTSGWESLVNSLLDSNLIITSAWPIHTEMKKRLRSIKSAALASSIYIVARKISRQPTAIYKDVRKEVEEYLDKKLERLWEEGIGGADFFIAGIGSSIEVFAKYQTVIDFEGNRIRAYQLIDDVRQIVTNFAVRQILKNGFSERMTPLTRFYLLYRWNFQDSMVDFDEARKLAQSCGFDITEHWNESSFIKKQNEFIKILGPKERKLESMKESPELIDILHRILLLWEVGEKESISNILIKNKIEDSDLFWRLIQAISETLPTQNKEKKLLDGFLAGKSSYIDREPDNQGTVDGKTTKESVRKKRRKPAPKMDSQDKYEQEELE